MTSLFRKSLKFLKYVHTTEISSPTKDELIKGYKKYSHKNTEDIFDFCLRSKYLEKCPYSMDPEYQLSVKGIELVNSPLNEWAKKFNSRNSLIFSILSLAISIIAIILSIIAITEK